MHESANTARCFSARNTTTPKARHRAICALLAKSLARIVEQSDISPERSSTCLDSRASLPLSVPVGERTESAKGQADE